MNLEVKTGWLILLLGTSYAGQASGDTQPKEMIDAVVESGSALTDLIKKFTSYVLAPVIAVLDQNIQQINTNIQGLTDKEKQLVNHSLEKLYNNRKEILVIRTLLVTLAEESISRTEQLKRIINKLDVGLSEKQIKRLIEYSARKMISLISRSTQILQESRTKYREISQGFSTIEANLKTFKSSVLALKDTEGPRYQKWVDKTRNIVYGAGAACVFIPPVCALYYPVAAGVLESKIAELKDALERLENACNEALDGIIPALGEVKKLDEKIASEIILIIKWQSKLAEMKDDFTTVDDVAFLVDVDKIGAIQMLNNLQKACQDYIDNPLFQ